MCSSKKAIAVLGSTGSIGTQTLDVVGRHSDKLQVEALAAHSNIDLLFSQAKTFDVLHVAVGDESLGDDPRVTEFRNWLEKRSQERGNENYSLEFGASSIIQLVKVPSIQCVVNALVGAAGLRASYETLKQKKQLALANKESLVVGGDLIMPLARSLDKEQGRGSGLLPIDSEHGAIYQCLIGEDRREVARLWVTASGGPFRGYKPEQLASITPERALAHPTWRMGPKITIDSSTLMNKGLEVIEAHHLFAMPYEAIEVVIQPQSAIHSMVEFTDGSVKAHLGTTDMRIPIQFALSYPERWSAPVAPMDFRTLGSLEFEAPDMKTFKCLALAREAGNRGGTLPAAMNAANEIAVASFLSGRCAYTDIAGCVEAVMDTTEVSAVESIEQLEAIDGSARKQAESWLAANAFA